MNFILLVIYLVRIIYKNRLNHMCIIYFMNNHGNNIPSYMVLSRMIYQMQMIYSMLLLLSPILSCCSYSCA